MIFNEFIVSALAELRRIANALERLAEIHAKELDRDRPTHTSEGDKDD